jgi:type IV pilus biogenesis protein CpaD/CtpE
MTFKWLRRVAAFASLALLAGVSACTETDPLYRDGLYQPSHTNRQNLTLMVANPTDLVRGSGTTTSDGQQAAAAVERWRNDKVKKLPSSDLAQITANSSGDNNSSGGSGGGGAGGQ